MFFFFFFSSRRRHTRSLCDWSSDVCSSDLRSGGAGEKQPAERDLTVYAPLTAPPTHGAFRWSNAKLLVPRIISDLRKIAGPHPVVVAYPPTRTTLGLLSGLDPRLVL